MWVETQGGGGTGAAVATRPSIASPLDPGRRIRAVLFDLDGTLYDQRRMRTLMAMELAAMLVRRPFQAPRSLRALAAFRKAQESLRHDAGSRPGPAAQLEEAAARLRMPLAETDAIVTEWMMRRPLKHLVGCRAGGVIELLAWLRTRGIEAGVLSDYPAAAKLEALEVAAWFSVVLCATDAEVGAFKPSPRGFLAAANRWGMAPAEILVVGDRADADAAGAAAAGMPCVIIGRTSTPAADSSRCLVLPSLERLRHVLDHDHGCR
ncbi:MAG: HAD-superfamily hydrolase, subfamily variant 1 [Acidobacteria bacterium]|nr:HAD-superfamily hydrolase, subfamily variant 1 [Acidobacteriota bacterium]